MRRNSFRALSAVTLASSIALATPALAASTDYLLTIKGVDGDTKAESQDDKHKNQIEILSYSWGMTRGTGIDGGGQSDALTDGLLVMRNTEQPAAGSAKVSKVEAISIKQSTTAASGSGRGAGKVVVHDVSIAPQPGRANDRLQNAGPRDGAPSSASSQRKWPNLVLKQGATESGGVSVAAGDVTGDGHDTSAPATLNRTRQKELLTPASAGSLSVIVAPGHGLCTAGKSLGTLTLAGSSGHTYVLKGVTVAGCEAATAGGRPAESLSLNYTKIEY